MALGSLDPGNKILVASALITLVGAVARLGQRMYRGIVRWAKGIEALLVVMHDQQSGAPGTMREDIDAVRQALTELQSVVAVHAAVISQAGGTDDPAAHP